MENVGVRKVAILIFDEVEVLDFCGPFEVFAVTGAAPANRISRFSLSPKSPGL